MLKIAGPFLVVVPLSTVPNWIKEFRKWTPQLNALVYVGDSKSRDVIRNYEFFNHKGAARPYRFEVLTHRSTDFSAGGRGGKGGLCAAPCLSLGTVGTRHELQGSKLQLPLTLLGIMFHAFKLLISHSCRVYGSLPNLEPVSKVLLQILHPSLAAGPD